jgi:hypothetical protein
MVELLNAEATDGSLRKMFKPLATFLAIIAVTWAASAQDATIPNYCRTIPIRSNASDWPNKHAWDLFVFLNHPALDKKFGRGQSDCTKPFGAPGTTSVWETWRNASSEVYLGNGAEPPAWDDTTLPDEKPGQVPALPRVASGRFSPAFSPGDGVFHNSGGFGETRLNRATYEFVRRECLFSRQGQQRYAKALGEGKKPPIQFPPDAIEVKAAWLDFEKEGVPGEKQTTYYTAEYGGKKYGLTAWHVLTKDLPNWFWASFHHKDSPPNAFETRDTYGQPNTVSETLWRNYRLGGVQTDFTSSMGAATILSDHYVEFGFQRSSCITCHATATISSQTPMPNAQFKALCAITPNLPALGLDATSCKEIIGADAFQAGTDKLVLERGVPEPKWFELNGKPFYAQTDFVWSIPFRGKNETGPPPARCMW